MEFIEMKPFVVLTNLNKFHISAVFVWFIRKKWGCQCHMVDISLLSLPLNFFWNEFFYFNISPFASSYTWKLNFIVIVSYRSLTLHTANETTTAESYIKRGPMKKKISTYNKKNTNCKQSGTLLLLMIIMVWSWVLNHNQRHNWP